MSRGQLFVVAAFTEIEDVALRDTDVFEHFPGRVRRALRLAAACLFGPSGKHRQRIQMSAATDEQLDQMLPKRGVGVRCWHR